jgi:hypothetical protein
MQGANNKQVMIAIGALIPANYYLNAVTRK